jgi:hypothetical protein
MAHRDHETKGGEGSNDSDETDTLEFAFDVGDHRVIKPREVWVVEEQDGFVSSLEIERAGRAREVVTVKKVGVRPLQRA